MTVKWAKCCAAWLVDYDQRLDVLGQVEYSSGSLGGVLGDVDDVGFVLGGFCISLSKAPR